MILLDTHAFYWFITDDPKLPESARTRIETDKEVYISIASFWEMAIKSSIGKLKLPASITELMKDCEEFDFRILPISGTHLEKLKDLPKIHGDPFDRLIICQAKAENLVLITKDENIPKYDVMTQWT